MLFDQCNRRKSVLIFSEIRNTSLYQLNLILGVDKFLLIYLFELIDFCVIA